MKKIASLAFCLGLAAALCFHSLAAGTAKIVRAFVYEGTLYTYISMDVEKPVTKAEAKVDGQTFPAAGRLETVRQAGAPVTWLLLVDNSTSMPAFRREVTGFARALAQGGGENTRYILASFGDAFSVVGEDVPAGELAERVEDLPFDERVTRLHTAIGQALDYFEEMPRERNELRCMVILSDAVQYDPRGGIPYEELLERVSQSGVILHSVGLGTDEAPLESLGRLAAASGGLHQTADVQLAQDAADKLIENSGELFVTSFDLSGCALEGGEKRLSITFASGGELLFRAEAQVELPEEAAQQPPEAVRPPEAPDRQPSEVPAQGTGGGGAGVPTGPPDAPPEVPVGLIAAAAAGVLAAAAAVVFLRKKDAAPEKYAQQETGVYIKLELLQGELADGKKQLELRDELVAGAGPACDIVVQGENAAERHVRIFLLEGAVYVEALDVSCVTLVNGEELEKPRRLRSGDEIAMGGAVIRLKF